MTGPSEVNRDNLTIRRIHLGSTVAAKLSFSRRVEAGRALSSALKSAIAWAVRLNRSGCMVSSRI